MDLAWLLQEARRQPASATERQLTDSLLQLITEGKMALKTHDATFYVQVEPEFSVTGSVLSIKAARITQRRPAPQLPGSVLVKLTLRIPDTAFMPLRPEAVIIVPEGLVHGEPPIEVTVGDASDSNPG